MEYFTDECKQKLCDVCDSQKDWIMSTGFKFNGIYFSAKLEAIVMAAGALTASIAGLPLEFPFTFYSGNDRVILQNINDLKMFCGSLLMFVQGTINNIKNTQDLIKSATTRIEAINYLKNAGFEYYE